MLSSLKLTVKQEVLKMTVKTGSHNVLSSLKMTVKTGSQNVAFLKMTVKT